MNLELKYTSSLGVEINMAVRVPAAMLAGGDGSHLSPRENQDIVDGGLRESHAATQHPVFRDPLAGARHGSSKLHRIHTAAHPGMLPRPAHAARPGKPYGRRRITGGDDDFLDIPQPHTLYSPRRGKIRVRV